MRNFILMLILMCSHLSAQTMNFQGIYDDGSEDTNIQLNIRVSLFYDPLDVPVWFDLFENIPLKSKVYNVLLGSGKPLDTLDFSRELWAQVSINDVNGSIHKLSTVPQSFNSMSLKGAILSGTTVEQGILVQAINGLRDSIQFAGTQGIILEKEGQSLTFKLDSNLTGGASKLEISDTCSAEQRSNHSFEAYYTCIDPDNNEIFMVGEDLNFISLGSLAFSTEDTEKWNQAYSHSQNSSIHFTSIENKNAAERIADSTQSGLLSAEDWQIFSEQGDLIIDMDSILKVADQTSKNAWSQAEVNRSDIARLNSDFNSNPSSNFTIDKWGHLVTHKNVIIGDSIIINDTSKTFLAIRGDHSKGAQLILEGQDFERGHIDLKAGNTYMGSLNAGSSNGTGNLFLTYRHNVVGATLDHKGNFGVGTQAPEEKLHVAGNLRVDGTISAGSIVQEVVYRPVLPSFLNSDSLSVRFDQTASGDIVSNIPVESWNADTLESMLNSSYHWTGLRPVFQDENYCGSGDDPGFTFEATRSYRGYYSMVINSDSEGYFMLVKWEGDQGESGVSAYFTYGKPGSLNDGKWGLNTMNAYMNNVKFFCN